MSAANLNKANVSLDDQATDSGSPEGWIAACLGEVANARLGKTPRRVDYRDSGVHRIVKFRDIVDNTIDYSKLKAAYVVNDPAVLRGLRPLNIRDVLITGSAHSGDQIGKKCAYIDHLPEIQGGIYFVGELLGVTSDPRVMDNKWPYYWFLSEDGLRAVQSAVAGVHLTAGRAQSIPIPIAPLEEQRRIVQKLDQFLPSMTAVKERLAKVKEILKRFRQSVLSSACSGRLTTDWRAKNLNYGSVEKIVHEIKRRRVEESKSSAQKEKIEDIYSYQELEDPEILPDTWEYVSLDKLCDSFQYGTSKKSQPLGKVAVLRMGNIQNGGIDWSDLVYTSDDTEIQKYRLKPGDVLFNRTNSPELVGKTGIYRGERPAVFAGYLIRINNFEELESHYLNCCLNTQYAREFYSRVKSDAVSQSNINAQKLGKFEVPFCSPEEQKEIVRRVEALFKIADNIEKRLAAATAQAEKLIQAILAKAFRGELVPAEAELAHREGCFYEPAFTLLANIKTQRKDVKDHKTVV